jgi:DNA recombination protein RmuC
MNEIAIIIANRAFSWGEVVLGSLALALCLMLWMALHLSKSRRERGEMEAAATERAHEMDDKIAELLRIQSEMTGRVQGVAEMFGSRQSDFVRMVSERMDGLQHRMGQKMEDSSRNQMDNLSKLQERLAVIDAAQKNLSDLTGEIVELKDVLSNKQSRGAFGQGMMEAIIKDGLPSGFYEFQTTLSNNKRPDCLVRLPGDSRGLVIDAKFPLEAFLGLRDAKGDEARNHALKRIRTDMHSHVKSMAEKYLIVGETQDIALMFVPAESLYADLHEHCAEIVQKAQRARIIIVSPSLLALAIQVIQSLARDARIRDEARTIQIEVGKLLEDISRLNDRVVKLDQHFRQAQEDVAQIRISSDKVTKRGQTIEGLEFDDNKPVLKAVLVAAE